MDKGIQKKANAFARKMGYGTATKIVPISDSEPKILGRTDYGYRKNTTGEYVPNAYRAKFGWKNTYYQPAETVVGWPEKEMADAEIN